MKMLHAIGVSALAAGAIAPYGAMAQDMSEAEYLAQLEEALPGDLMNNPLDPQWNVYGDDVVTRVVKADIPGERAFQVKVKRAKDQPYAIGVQGRVTEGVRAGDTVLIAFWGRAQTVDKATGAGYLQFRLQQSNAPYEAVLEGDVRLENGWQVHYLSGVATRDFLAGDIGVVFNVARYAQTLELGQYYVMNLGPGVATNTLPSGSVDP